MYDLLMLGATKPHIPIILAILLYMWIALGSYMVNEKELAGMWLMYAFANAFMAAKYLK